MTKEKRIIYILSAFKSSTKYRTLHSVCLVSGMVNHQGVEKTDQAIIHQKTKYTCFL